MQGRLRPIASRDRRDGSLKLWQDACLFATLLVAGESISYPSRDDHKACVYVVLWTSATQEVNVDFPNDHSPKLTAAGHERPVRPAINVSNGHYAVGHEQLL